MRLVPPPYIQLDSCLKRRWYACRGKDLRQALAYAKTTAGGPPRWLELVVDIYGDRMDRNPELRLEDIAEELSAKLAEDAGAGVA